MQFNTFEYFYFLLFIYVLCCLVFQKHLKRNFILLVASIVFYGWWNISYVFLLLAYGVVNYILGIKIEEVKHKQKLYLWLASIFNFGVLFFYKYLSAFIQESARLFSIQPSSIPSYLTDILLPIGISFYTFQAMSYIFDVYYENIKAIRSKTDFMLYVAFFPQLVAGPILRASEFLPQLKQNFEFNKVKFYSGIFFILWGLLKKNAVADPIGIYLVDPVYNHPENYSSFDILISNYAYLVQIYGDFSGYSDIAIGSALLLGFTIPQNFDQPFYATNSSDYWNRWHISLSHWVRDYIFYPLSVGWLAGKIKWSLFTSILIIGVWHGASYLYIIFGLLHAGASIGHQLFKKKLSKYRKFKISKYIAWFCYWHFLTLTAWVFRAGDSKKALDVLNAFLNNFNSNSLLSFSFELLFSILLAITLHHISAKKIVKLSESFSQINTVIKILCIWFVCFTCLHYDFLLLGRKAFIYFQF